MREYRQRNKEKVYEVEKKWRAENPDRVNAARQKWKDANKEAGREFYKKNTEKIKQRAKLWYESNKTRSAAYKREYHRKNPEVRVNGKAKRRTSIGNDRLPYGTIPKLFKSQNGLCACCSQPLVKYHVDHILPLALGGRNIPENLQLLLPVCNMKKSKKHPELWRKEKGI